MERVVGDRQATRPADVAAVLSRAAGVIEDLRRALDEATA